MLCKNSIGSKLELEQGTVMQLYPNGLQYGFRNSKDFYFVMQVFKDKCHIVTANVSYKAGA